MPLGTWVSKYADTKATDAHSIEAHGQRMSDHVAAVVKMAGDVSGANARTSAEERRAAWGRWLQGKPDEPEPPPSEDEVLPPTSSELRAQRWRAERRQAYKAVDGAHSSLRESARNGKEAEAAASFDSNHQRHGSQARLLLLKTGVNSDGLPRSGHHDPRTPQSFRSTIVTLMRDRYVAPYEPVSTGFKRHERKAVAFDLYKSIWKERVKWADSKDLFESSQQVISSPCVQTPCVGRALHAVIVFGCRMPCERVEGASQKALLSETP